MPLLFVCGWRLAHEYPRQAPPPKWTRADLPPTTSADDNGWTLVTRPLALEIPPTLAAWIDLREPDPGLAWAGLDHHRLRELLASPAAGEALARIEAAAARPEFRDACVESAPCGLFEWHAAHDLAILRACAAALTGDGDRSIALLATLVRLDRAQLASARSLISVLVAVDQLEDSFAKIDLVLARVAPDTDTAALVNALAGELELDLRPLVIADYLARLEAVELRLGSQISVWPAELAWTRADLDAEFDRRYAAAGAAQLPAALGVGLPPSTSTPLWWLRNPGGKLLLDELSFDASELAAELDERLARVARTRGRLHGLALHRPSPR